MSENGKNNKKLALMPHVLVVDDDARIRDLLLRYLSEHGFVVMAAGDAAEAKQVLERFEVDVIVLDVMMPGQTGVEFAQEYKAEHETPILLLTALGDTEDRIAGLEAGADDYLAKPFEPRELLLRLNAILKRTMRVVEELSAFRMGRWVFDPDEGALQCDESGEYEKLTLVELNLIKALAQDAGEVVSRDELAKRCDLEAGERTIDVQVTRLRRKIEEDTKNPRYLQTIRGKGYLLRMEEL